MNIDSQAVKNTCNASAASKGFCFYKATNGIKRHLAVDSLGIPFFTHCTRASVSDDQGRIEMLTQNIDSFRQKPSGLAKTTILLDHGYHPETIQQALEQVYPEDYHQNSVSGRSQTLESPKSSARKVRVCTCGGAVGD